MIQAFHITKGFHDRILFEDLSFSLEKGINLIQGISGCGKSTLIKILMGILPCDQGEIAYQKEDIVFSYAGQDDSLFGKKSLRQNIDLFLADIDQERMQQLSRLLNFKFMDRKISSLSGGERQKAEIIYCLSKIADVYFLDEPFSSIDDHTKQQLVLFLNEFSSQHYIVLVNHDITLDDLKIAKNIDLSQSEKTEKASSIVSYPVKTKDSYFLSVKSYFHSKFWSSLWKSILCLASFVLFALGVSYVNSDSTIDSIARRLYHDPFSVHAMCYSRKDISLIDSSFFEYINAKGRECLVLDIENSPQKTVFVGGYDDEFYFYSNLEKRSITIDQVISLDEKDYPLVVIDDERLNALMPEKSKFLQSIQDKYETNCELILCSNQFIDDVLLSSAKNITTSIDDLHFEEISGYQFDQNEGKLCGGTNLFLSANVIEDRQDFYLSLPGNYVGKTIAGGQKGLKVVVNDNSIDNKIHVSLPLVKLFNLNDDFGDDRKNYTYSCELNDADYITYIEQHSVPLMPVDCLHDSSISGESFYFTYFVLSIICLSLYLFFSFFTRKVNRRWYRKQKNIFQRNQMSVRSLNLGLLISHYLEIIPALLISFIGYLVFFIPLANEQLMIAYDQPRVEGYYYYSQQPLNPYYDGYTKPIEWIHFEPLILCLFIAFILIPLIHYYWLTREKKR